MEEEKNTDDEGVFEIIDHTTVSPWERFGRQFFEKKKGINFSFETCFLGLLPM